MSMLQHNLIDFSVEAYHDGALETIGKEDLLGHWSLLFFYPAGFSFVCPTELEDLQDHYAEFKKAGCEIYSVSCDTQWVHKAWHDANEKIGKVQYPMLADTTGKLARDLKTYNEESGLAERGDFIIDPEGKVVAYEVISSNVGRNAEEILRRVKASQFVYEHGDQVCPAKWEPGDETLEPSLDLVGEL
ncbi:peroxiredoxin [Bifidobacterium animalis subsp. animalis MCC 1489]|uniref:Peroxiredoxin n=1 Tax=Bifidobacterium animalis subsp. animalis IM386 TaxID=1402194 RepID=A0AAV2W4K1_9BIFI|nr:redoxin domain-containing protein [Bifidobacterium animalis]AFI63068.1 peroxiredoxin [Bifidobacterium animalis subsp. animalis ATCC 25527]AYN23703.1 peroxiredoxin [Bifidobacterium animalis subsp. animalis]KFI43540.1 peroxiredoxin [Bifidobacterium animalis subsp. animalis]KOA64912.1 peroxiredoxin [Bifidobacterium animalis subsp. animalis MCC 1489]CDI67817.1 Peroxiredoxin [Bifidobacterium animalis subsp. animalis IM386]